MARRYLHILFITLLAVLATACGGEDDYRYTGEDTPGTASGGSTYGIPTVVTQLQKHTLGKGVPFVIMCDGYTQSDIDNGTYRKITMQAMEALFAEEPMTSLREYFDIFEATAASQASGVGSTKGNTVFETYIPGGNTTDIKGNDSIVQAYATAAMYKMYNTGAKDRMQDLVAIVIPNSEVYAGITYLTVQKTAGDIPHGYSMAFIPAHPMRTVTIMKNGQVVRKEKRDLFTTTLQHEAVGHGLAKLADEYSYDTNGTPTTVQKKEFAEMQTCGAYMNVTTESDVTRSPWADLAADEAYSSEGLRCILGAYTYSNTFYRPTMNSIMNESVSGFNAPSRRAIYKRVMSIAYGASWKYDYQDFVTFDRKTQKASAKGARQAVETIGTHLAQPIVTIR